MFPFRNDYDNPNPFTPSESTGPSTTDIEELKANIDRLMMITEALWDILREKYDYSEEELVKRVYEIDARDGVIDGRKRPTPSRNCPHCNRKLAKKRPRCIYCGQLVTVDLFEA